MVNIVGGLGLSWQASFGIILSLYFYSHYFFASGAAHIGAMYTAFLSVAVACGTPAFVAAIALAQLSNVMGCLSTYGIGSAPPYYGAGMSGSMMCVMNGMHCVGCSNVWMYMFSLINITQGMCPSQSGTSLDSS